MKTLDKISVIIITYNEEENIRDCFESVQWADEIIVVDSGSGDKTLKICKEYTDKIFQKIWLGFGLQKEYARNLANFDWVLSIDADERISEGLRNEILSKELDKDGYYIPRKLFFLGKLLRFGGCCDKQIRLFRKDTAKFSDDSIHERVIINGSLDSLKNPILHYSYKNISDYFERFNRYSDLEAERKVRSQESRVRRKREEIRSQGSGDLIFVFQVILSFLDFIKRYIFKLGILDGIPGFLWALFSSFHRLVKYAKIWEKIFNI